MKLGKRATMRIKGRRVRGLITKEKVRLTDSIVKVNRHS